MIKIKILNPTVDRNEPTFRVMLGCADLLKTYSIEITDSDDYDYLFVGMNDFINKKYKNLWITLDISGLQFTDKHEIVICDFVNVSYKKLKNVKY